MTRGFAVLLDFDGLLADTEEMHSRTWCAALAEVGVIVTAEEYAAHWIRAGRGIAELIEERRLPHTVEVLLARKKARYDAELPRLREMPGATALLDRLRGRCRTALVTSGRRAMVADAVAHLGMDGRFDATVTFEMVVRAKPDPECMLRAAALLGVAPADCVAIDDAEKGIVAAAEAGVAAVAVPNDHTRHHDFSRASLVVPSLADLDAGRLAALVARGRDAV